VLFALTARTETGKADAGIDTAARTALAVHRERVETTRPALRMVAADPRLQSAIVRGRIGSARRRMRKLVRGDVVAIELWSARGRRLAQAGSGAGVAWRGSELVARLIERLTELEVVVFRGRRQLASTLPGAARVESPPPGESSDISVDGHEYRGRVVRLELAGPPVDLAILRPTAPFADHIADNRLLIAGFLTLFVLLALASATFVSRALTGQIATLLAAARRLSRGDFRQLVPVEGKDEFAELGREFNDMSEQLEAKIDEVERKRQELEETIRRVGDALATGLDRHGLVALAVRQAVDACEAEVGRALPLARGAFAASEVGSVAGELEQVIEAAERDVFVVRPDVGPELLGALEGDESAERTRRAVSAESQGVHALSIGLRSLVDGPEYLGASRSRARRRSCSSTWPGRPWSPSRTRACTRPWSARR
jgi:HAMP domain-containing protein